MQYLFKILILTISVISFNVKGQNVIMPIISDSIPITKNLMNISGMIEGGYELIGISKGMKAFEIKNLEKKSKDYFYEYFKYINLNDVELSHLEDTIIEIDESIEIPITERIGPIKPILEVVQKPYTFGDKSLKIIVDSGQRLNMPDYIDNSQLSEKLEDGVTTTYSDYSNSQKEFLSKYYKTSNELKQAYPIFIYNQSDSIVRIDTKENWVYMIQEAKNKKGDWIPIEYFDYKVICGNSFGDKFLLPNYYVISKIYKYSGSFKTTLRVKFMTDNKVFYSNEFEGHINKTQFELPKRIKKESLEKRKRRFFNN